MSRLQVYSVLVFALILAASCYAQEFKVFSRWDYGIGSKVASVAVGDVDGDGQPEFVAASEKSIYVFEGNGSLRSNYNVSFSPSVVYLTDTNNDSVNEILIGSGDIKTINYSAGVFNFSDTDNIIQKPEVLYKTTTNLGDVYIIEGGKAPKLFLSVGNWVRDISSGDLNNDGVKDYLVAAGGINIDYVKKAHLEDSKPELMWQKEFDSDYDQCSDIIDIEKKNLSSVEVQCQFMNGYNYLDINLTQGINGVLLYHVTLKAKTDLCDDAEDMFKSYYSNMTVTCKYIRVPSSLVRPKSYSGYMEVNFTQPPRLAKTWVVDDVEVNSNGGSVLVFSLNGSILLNKTFNVIPWYVYPASFTGNSSKMVAEGSEPIVFLGMDGKAVSSYKSPEENYSVREVFTDNIRGEKLNDLVVGFAGNKVAGVYVLDRDSKLYWMYKIIANEFKGLFEVDIDADNESDIVFATEKYLYSLDKLGNLKLVYDFQRAVDKIAVGDLDGNGFMDFVVGSSGKVYVYEVDELLVKAGLADRYIKGAREDADLGKYESAVLKAEKAKSLYSQLSNSKGVSDSDSLLVEINKNLGGIRKETADSLYKKGRSEYYLGNYNDSREFLGKALEIYEKINDSAGIAKTQSALSEIVNEQNPATTTTRALSQDSTTSTTLLETNVDISGYLPIAAGLIVLLLIVIIVKMGLFSRHAKEKDAAEKDVIRKS